MIGKLELKKSASHRRFGFFNRAKLRVLQTYETRLDPILLTDAAFQEIVEHKSEWRRSDSSSSTKNISTKDALEAHDARADAAMAQSSQSSPPPSPSSSSRSPAGISPGGSVRMTSSRRLSGASVGEDADSDAPPSETENPIQDNGL